MKGILVTLFALGALNSILQIGQPRSPYTPSDAAVTLVVSAALVIGTLVFL